MAGQERTRIKVVPHFMRLHEWIALEEGYYHDEGPEPETLADVMHRVSTHRGDQLQGDHDYSTFGLGELLFFEPYTAEDFGAALQFARKWGLHLNVRDDRYENLIVPVGVE